MHQQKIHLKERGSFLRYLTQKPKKEVSMDFVKYLNFSRLARLSYFLRPYNFIIFSGSYKCDCLIFVESSVGNIFFNASL